MEKGQRITIEDAFKIVRQIDRDIYKHIPIGRNNFVFLSKNKCISIPKDQEKIRYDIRAAAMRYLQEHSIPTTELLSHGIHEGIEYIITKKIDAQNIDVTSLSLAEQINVHEQCALVAHKLHELKTNGYGRLNQGLTGPYTKWSEFVIDFFESVMKRLYTTDILRDKFSRLLNEKFSAMSYLLEDQQIAFLHGDYHIGNILFKKGELKALIDLDIVMNGDIYWDLGHYVRTFKGDRSKGLDAFSHAYGEWNIDKANYYAMIIWTRKLASQGESRPEAFNETIPEMERILKWSI